MPLSPSEELTAQFYEWELRGRGWHCAPHAVQLEPPFHPFFGHFVQTPYVDDGTRPTFLSGLADLFRGAQKVPEIQQHPLPEFEPFPFEDTATLAGYAIGFGRNGRPSIDLMEQCLVMLSNILAPVSFEIVADRDAISVRLVYRKPYGTLLYGQLKIFFPDAGIVPLPELEPLIDRALSFYTVDYGLRDEWMRPIGTQHGHADSLIGLYGMCDQLQGNERVTVQVLFNGTQNRWAPSVERAVGDQRGGSFFLDAPEMPTLAKEKCRAPLFAATVRIVAQDERGDAAMALLQRVSFALTQATTSPFNALVPLPPDGYGLAMRMMDIELRQSHRVGMLLNSRELATLAHFPAPSLSRKLITQHRATKAAPAFLNNGAYILGTNTHQGNTVTVGLDTAQRLKHLHLIGATGTGKSTLLHSLVMQDVLHDGGLCVIDPYGDLVESILASIPQGRIRDVVLIDPADTQYPVGFNVLSAHSDQEKELLASDLVGLFRRFSTSWGDQMNSVFANAVSAFVYNSRVGTLADMRKFFVEQPFRSRILATCTDPDIVYYWQKEYPLLKSSSIGSILTRLDSFLRPKVIRNMVAQQQSLNFQALMDGKKIVLVKLSQGLLGEENSYLLGAFIVSKLQQTAMARQEQSRHDRVPFYCYIDEFHHFITPSMSTMLSGTRQYGLGLVLAHQDMQKVQSLDANIASSLLSNAGTRVCFRVGDSDAKRLGEGFSAFSAEDLQNLGVGEAIVRVNTTVQDFNIAVVPYCADNGSYKAEIVEHSRNSYGVPIAPAAEPEPSTEPATSIPQAAPTQPPKDAEPPIDTTQQKDMREHRYLQTFIKKLAEEHGYKASMEVRTPDGAGQVDVLLEKDGAHVAVEISVTTSAAWELHNIRKCLAAGYAQVVVCTNSQAKILQIQGLIASALPAGDRERVRVMTAEEIPLLFAQTPKRGTTTHKGYRVRVQYEQGGGNQSDIIRRIINSRKP